MRAVGPVTAGDLRARRRATSLGVRGPFGTGWPVEDRGGGDVLVVAGGVGLAPLRPVLYAALADRERVRAVALLFGAR